ncbi:MAG: hypothetical protein ACJAZY_002846 [Spirosomataceae bacterium]|jgi:hypothetical protein
MNWDLLLENLTNPALLFFFLGLIAVQLKSDLEVPENSSKFISIYLLFSIGFKGGQELSHSHLGLEILWALVFGILLALVVPVYTYFILRRNLDVENSAAIAAAYGSVSAVTFITAISYLDAHDIPFGGHMVAVMALMEAPSIIVGLLLYSTFNKKEGSEVKSSNVIKHALTNGSVVLILGSLAIGFMANEEQAQGIKPFTNDIFKGFLAIFLLDMGITSGKKIGAFLKRGWFTLLFAILIPLFNGCVVAILSGFVSDEVGDRFIFAILAASASYIAVPAAMRMAIPKANPGLYIPMALAVTFPFNITLGMPIYYFLVQQ